MDGVCASRRKRNKERERERERGCRVCVWGVCVFVREREEI